MRLHVHPVLKRYMYSVVLPFRKYLQLFACESTTEMPLNHAEIFEWMLLTHFQGIFLLPASSGSVLPDFFDTMFFGPCESIVFSKKWVESVVVSHACILSSKFNRS